MFVCVFCVRCRCRCRCRCCCCCWWWWWWWVGSGWPNLNLLCCDHCSGSHRILGTEWTRPAFPPGLLGQTQATGSTNLSVMSIGIWLVCFIFVQCQKKMEKLCKLWKDWCCSFKPKMGFISVLFPVSILWFDYCFTRACQTSIMGC